MSVKSFYDRIAALFPGQGRVPIQSQPPELLSPERFPYGPFRFEVVVPMEGSYRIEATTNLKNWLVLSNAHLAGRSEFVDSEASKFSYRFYRLTGQDIPSSNVLGYATVPFPPGFSMIANPFLSTAASVSQLFREVP